MNLILCPDCGLACTLRVSDRGEMIFSCPTHGEFTSNVELEIDEILNPAASHEYIFRHFVVLYRSFVPDLRLRGEVLSLQACSQCSCDPHHHLLEFPTEAEAQSYAATLEIPARVGCVICGETR